MFKTWLSWSGGKDCVWTLHQLVLQNKYDVTKLFVTINEKYHRVAMHGIPEILVLEQIKAVNMSCCPVYIPDPCDNALYQKAMQDMIDKAITEEIQYMAFGDLFLADIRTYRETQLSNTKIQPIFPLWQKPTKQLANQIIDAGFKAIVCCVDIAQLPVQFLGRLYDKTFLEDLPVNIDPCGENGEFHTFVYDGPIFNAPLDLKVMSHYYSGQFAFIDIQPNLNF